MLKRVKRKNRPAQNAAGRFLRRVFFYVDVLGYLLLKGSTELIALLCDGAAVAQAVDGADDVLLGRFGMEGTHPQHLVSV